MDKYVYYKDRGKWFLKKSMQIGGPTMIDGIIRNVLPEMRYVIVAKALTEKVLLKKFDKLAAGTECELMRGPDRKGPGSIW